MDARPAHETDQQIALASARLFDLMLDQDFEIDLALALAFDEAFGFDFGFGTEMLFRPPALADAA